MTANERELEKRVGKKMEKSVRTYFGGYKTAVLLGVLGAIITLVMNLHGVEEEWAWEIAKSIITIDGIIIGFTIIGVTMFSSERKEASSRMTEIFGEHFAGFWNELKVSELSDIKGIQRRFASRMESAVVEILVVPTSIPVCMILLTVSIALALSLFGVNDATADNKMLAFVFTTALGLSVTTLFVGIYLVYKFIQEYVNITSRVQLLEAYKRARKEFEDKIDEKKEK